MKQLSSAINDLFRSLKITKKLDEWQAVVRWGEIVGEQIAHNTEAISIEKGVLLVRAANPVWRQQLHFTKSELIAKLNMALGYSIVKDIKLI